MQRIHDNRAQRIASGRRLLAAAALLMLAACKASDPQVSAGGAAAAEPRCGMQGFLVADLVGAIATDLAWNHNELECAGMRRPDGAGARLRFAGPLPASEDRRLAIIIAIPGLVRGETGTDLSTNVTVTEEGTGRFFSTADLNNCWADISSLEPNESSASAYSIAGALYCVAPLAEVNGSASITIAELEFRGLLDWDAT